MPCKLTKFQFLMVRLKDKYFDNVVVRYEKFQFLMVRLKAIDDFIEPNLFFYFNSLWCD